jgi:hypothetical protein
LSAALTNLCQGVVGRLLVPAIVEGDLDAALRELESDAAADTA